VNVAYAGEIRGTVLDASTQQPLSGVNIYLMPQRVKAATSDAQGNYHVEALSSGSYQVMASYIGYNIQVKGVAVSDLGVVEADFEIILSALDVETSVVAASKREQTLNEAPTSVSVVFAQEVAEADGATTLAEVLKYTIGLDYVRGFEGHYNISARGFNNYLNNTVLLLIDGRTVNTPQTNVINWSGVTISEHEIDRIEVIKGPGSALYGANAFSGVINIITKSPRELEGTTASVSAGSRGTFSGSLTTAGVREKLAYKISGGYFENDDFIVPAVRDTIPGVKPTPTNYRTLKGDFRVEYDASEVTQMTYAAGFASQTNHKLVASSAAVNSDHDNDFYAFGKLKHRNFTLQSYYNGARSDTIRGTGVNTGTVANADVFKLEVQQSLNIGKRNRLIVGGEYEWRRFDSEGLLIPEPVTQNLFGLYGQFEAQLRPKLNLILAGRVDRHPTVDFQVSPKAGLIFSPSNEQSLRLTVNQAYVNPVFIEQFTQFSIEFIPGFLFGVRGNPNLDPRKITAYEFGYQAFFQKKFRLNLDFYHYDLKDFISAPRIVNFNDPEAVSHVNFGSVSTNGIDWGLLYLINRGLQWSFNLSLIKPNNSPVFSQNLEEDTTDEIPALNAPEFKFSSAISYESPLGIYGRAAIRFVDSYKWAEEVTTPLPRTFLTTIDSYAIPDITIGYRAPTDDFRVSVSISNLFDKNYLEIPKGGFLRRKIIASLTTHF
jgi:iron complex outermembrane receptor protein